MIFTLRRTLDGRRLAMSSLLLQVCVSIMASAVLLPLVRTFSGSGKFATQHSIILYRGSGPHERMRTNTRVSGD